MIKAMTRLGTLLAVLLGSTATVQAGGLHYNVGVGSLFFSDQPGQLSGVQMNWLHDPDVSAVIMDGRDLSTEGLLQIGDDMLTDIAGINYFATVRVDGQPVATARAELVDVKLNGNQGLQLSLVLPLQQPVAVANKTISLQLADPEGTAVLLYANPQMVALDDELQALCAPPEVTEQALDMNGHEMKVQMAVLRCR